MKLIYFTEGYKSLTELLSIMQPTKLWNILTKIIEGMMRVEKFGFLSCENVDVSPQNTYLDPKTLKFLKFANKVFVISGQDEYSAFKLEVLKYNINFSDKEKYSFICNCYEKQKNALLEICGNTGTVISGYIEKTDPAKMKNANDLKGIEGIIGRGKVIQ